MIYNFVFQQKTLNIQIKALELKMYIKKLQTPVTSLILNLDKKVKGTTCREFHDLHFHMVTTPSNASNKDARTKTKLPHNFKIVSLEYKFPFSLHEKFTID